MINYGSFQFACPPRTGTMWFIGAAQLSGFGAAFKPAAHMPFPPERGKVLRVSLVRHPCNWLASCYSAICERTLTTNHLSAFTRLDISSFDCFVNQYLENIPGSIGELYNRYMADSCLRIEDMPWAFVELLSSLGVSSEMKELCKHIGKRNTSESLPTWDKRLWRLVMKSESEICEAYDYY